MKHVFSAVASSPSLISPDKAVQNSLWRSLFWVLGLYVLAGLEFRVTASDGMRWAILAVMASMAIGFLLARLRGQTPVQVSRIEWFALGFCVWIGLSGLWSPVPQTLVLILPRALILLILAASLLRLPNLEAWLRPFQLICVAVAGLVAMGFVMPQAYGFYGNENFETEILCALFPFVAVYALSGKAMARGVAIALCSLVLIRLGMNPSKSELGAVFGVGVAVSLWLVWPGQGMLRRGIGLAVAIGLAVVAWAVFRHFQESDSVAVRLDLWQIALTQFGQKPLLGQGVGAFAARMPLYVPGHEGLLRAGLGNMMGAAHSDPLQILAEQGLVGTGLLLLVLVPIFGRALRWRREDGALALACALSLAAMLGLAMTGFPLQKPATLSLAVFNLAVWARMVPVLGIKVQSMSRIWLDDIGKKLLGGIAVTLVGLALILNLLDYAALRVADLRGSRYAQDTEKAWGAVYLAHRLSPANRDIGQILWPVLFAWHQDKFTSVAYLRNHYENIAPEFVDYIAQSTFRAAPYAVQPRLLWVRSVLVQPQWQEQQQKISDTLKDVQAYASHLPLYWETVVLFNLKMRDEPALQLAIEQGLALPDLPPVTRQRLESLQKESVK